MTRRLQYRVLSGQGLIIPTPLYVDDESLAEVILGDESHRWANVRSIFERQGMPTARASVRGLYYFPAVIRFLDRREGIASFDEDYPDDGPDNLGPR